MTISRDLAAPLFTVIWATGQQGRSVINAISASQAAYRVRGLMRDTAKAGNLAGLGVEAVVADAEDAISLEQGMKGAKIVFAMTNPDFAAWPSGEAEERQGKKLADAAKAAGVETFVLTSLTGFGELSQGKHTIAHFDAKDNVAKYARSLSSSMKVKTVLPGIYASNYWTSIPPRKQPDGSFVVAQPMSPQTRLPILDAAHDFGRYVLAAVQDGGPDKVLAGGHYLSLEEIAAVMAKFSGQTVTYRQLSPEILTKIVGENLSSRLTAIAKAVDALGYYGGESLDKSNSLLDPPPRTLLEALEGNKEVAMKVFS